MILTPNGVRVWLLLYYLFLTLPDGVLDETHTNQTSLTHEIEVTKEIEQKNVVVTNETTQGMTTF